MNVTVTIMPESLYWTCGKCHYKQLHSMGCYCATFEAMRREWAANQNVATVASVSSETAAALPRAAGPPG